MKKENDKEQERTEATEANEKLQDAFYDEDENKDINPANLNNQSAILPKND